MKFSINHTDENTAARAGTISTAHGHFTTPVFMPVGTTASVKGLDQKELAEVAGAEILLANTYHLFLRPGTEILQQAGGLHHFMSWDRSLLTDSGGYQVYSLSKSRKISEEGVSFSSHIDGSKLFLSPEKATDVQRKIGADIIMAFDECPPYPSTYKYAEDSMNLTHRWLRRCIDRFAETEAPYNTEQTLAPIVQGSTYSELRKASAEFVSSCGLAMNAIGGLSVGEPHEEMYVMTEEVCEVLPADKPRYLMGVGTPGNMLECIARGVDMFDCVMPTRNGRHGMLFTMQGVINIKNSKWSNHHTPFETQVPSSPLHNYKMSYLRHLFTSKELLGTRITSLHNICFYLHLMRSAREHIAAGDYKEWYQALIPQLQNRI